VAAVAALAAGLRYLREGGDVVADLKVRCCTLYAVFQNTSNGGR
jgi:hypothetical protein